MIRPYRSLKVPPSVWGRDATQGWGAREENRKHFEPPRRQLRKGENAMTAIHITQCPAIGIRYSHAYEIDQHKENQKCFSNTTTPPLRQSQTAVKSSRSFSARTT